MSGSGRDGAAAIELEGISKRFGRVQANRDVDFACHRAEVHALVGENGAGKSTLMKIAYGLVTPDSGAIAINGRDVPKRWSPAAAIDLGVGMVHQHFMLVEPLTVAENIVLGAEPGTALHFDRRRAAAEISEVADRFGLVVDAEARVEDLSVGEKQRVEILKVLWRGCDVLILDEPTAVLTPGEVAAFFEVLRELVASDMAVVLITHKLDEVLSIADRITVMRRGELVGELEAEGASPADIARAMVGRPVLLEVDKAPATPGDPVLEIAELSVRRSRGDLAIDGIDLAVRAGEIVGVAGVEGNGQRELIDAIAGLATPERGAIRLLGTDITGATVGDRLRAGLAHIPEDRHARGLVLGFSVAENLILGREHVYSSATGLDLARIAADADRAIAEHDIRPADREAMAAGLSGGNQQKIVIARELSREPLRLLLASQPTRGVDVGAIERIHREIIGARDRGAGVLLVSAELSELRGLADRLLVIYKGRIVAELSADEIAADGSLERIGAMMTGASAGAGHHDPDPPPRRGREMGAGAGEEE